LFGDYFDEIFFVFFIHSVHFIAHEFGFVTMLWQKSEVLCAVLLSKY
jgi:hypothetical protein